MKLDKLYEGKIVKRTKGAIKPKSDGGWWIDDSWVGEELKILSYDKATIKVKFLKGEDKDDEWTFGNDFDDDNWELIEDKVNITLAELEEVVKPINDLISKLKAKKKWRYK